MILRAAPIPSPGAGAHNIPVPRALCAGSAHPILELGRQEALQGANKELEYVPKWQLRAVQWRNCRIELGVTEIGSAHHVTRVYGRGRGLLPSCLPLCPQVTLSRIILLPFHHLHAPVGTDGRDTTGKEVSHLHLSILPGRVQGHLPGSGRVGQGC